MISYSFRSQVNMCVIASMNWRKRPLLMLAVLLSIGIGAFGQSALESAEKRVDDRIQDFIKAADNETSDLASRAWSQWQEGTLDKETIALLQYKIAWGIIQWSEEIPDEVSRWLEGEWQDDVELGATRISMRLGGHFFHHSKYEKALDAFLIAEKAAFDIDSKTKSLENIAVCYVQLENLDEAIRYFEIAMKLREEKPNSLTVSNLAGIYNELGAHDKALTTLELIDWDTEVGSVKRMALINKLSALRHFNDRKEDMESAYVNLTQQFPVPIYPQEVAEVVRAALLLDDTAHVQGIRAEAQAIVNENREFAEQWMPELMLLFDAEGDLDETAFEELPWASRWGMAQWLVKQGSQAVSNSSLNQRAEKLEADLSMAMISIERSQDQLWLVIAVALGLTGLLGLTAWQRLQVSRLRRQVAGRGLALNPADFQAIEVIRDAITQGKNINTALVHLSNLNDLINHKQQIVALKDTNDPLLKELNNSELQLLDQILRGYSSKEISIIMNVSAGHIYNMRSMVREKLGLDREVDLQEWLRGRYSDPAKTEVRAGKAERG